VKTSAPSRTDRPKVSTEKCLAPIRNLRHEPIEEKQARYATKSEYY
jgi:hypothetical protein